MTRRSGRTKVRSNKRKQQLRKRRQFVAPVLITLLCMILLSLGIVIFVGQQNEKVRLEQRRQELYDELAAMEEDGRRLAELEAQVGTPEYIEKIARQELGMGHEDEVFFEDQP